MPGKLENLHLRAINFSAYGASFVHIDARVNAGYPDLQLSETLSVEKLKKDLYDQYGGEFSFSMMTASPVLGSLNSGMQLYRIKNEQPDLFHRSLIFSASSPMAFLD